MEIKIECSCGTRFAFEVEPVNGQMPATIFCPKCGVDATDSANAIIQQNSAPPSASIEPTKSRLRVAASHTAPTPPLLGTEADEQIEFCARHPRNRATSRCVVCQKAICP